MEGMDITSRSYRLRIGKGASPLFVLLVPEDVIKDSLGLARKPHHDEAYRWIAAHEGALKRTFERLRSGDGDIPAPFDRCSLTED